MLKIAKKYIAIIKQIQQLPREQITLSGDRYGRIHFDAFTRRHRLLVFRNKEIGVALISINGTFKEYLQGSFKETLRRNRNRAIKEGFTFRKFKTSEFFNDMLEVNRSMEIRQGREMSIDYTNEQILKNYLSDKPEMFGVFDQKGNLRSYVWIVFAGEAAIVARLLGHGHDLEKGVMWLLLSEVFRELLENKADNPQLKWFVYDTLFGASSGLRFFKERMGYLPYRVVWKWKNFPPSLN